MYVILYLPFVVSYTCGPEICLINTCVELTHMTPWVEHPMFSFESGLGLKLSLLSIAVREAYSCHVGSICGSLCSRFSASCWLRGWGEEFGGFYVVSYGSVSKKVMFVSRVWVFQGSELRVSRLWFRDV